MITVFCTTIGRPTLKQALDSLVGQEFDSCDQVVLAHDGPESHSLTRLWESYGFSGKLLNLEKGPNNDWGQRLRNTFLPSIKDGHVIHLDDDDILLPETLRVIRQSISRTPNGIFLYKSHWENGPCYPVDQGIRFGNVGTSTIVHPMKDVVLPEFGPGHGGDFDFVSNFIKNNPSCPVRWCSYVTHLLRPNTHTPPYVKTGLLREGIWQYIEAISYGKSVLIASPENAQNLENALSGRPEMVMLGNTLECVPNPKDVFQAACRTATSEVILTGNNLVAFGGKVSTKYREFSPSSLMMVVREANCEFYTTRHHDGRNLLQVSKENFLYTTAPHYLVKVIL